MTMPTHQQGYTKIHRGCGGVVRFVESLDSTHWEWDAECTKCGAMLTEEDYEIKKRCEQPVTAHLHAR